MGLVTIYTKKGVMKDGKIIIPFEYDDIKPATIDGEESNDIFITKKDDMIGAVKLGDSPFCPIKIKNGYHSISCFEKGIAVISEYCDRIGEKFGIIDTNLEILTIIKYDKISRVSAKFFDVVEDGKHGIIDSKGKLIIACEFDNIHYNEEENTFQIS